MENSIENLVNRDIIYKIFVICVDFISEVQTEEKLCKKGRFLI